MDGPVTTTFLGLPLLRFVFLVSSSCSSAGSVLFRFLGFAGLGFSSSMLSMLCCTLPEAVDLREGSRVVVMVEGVLDGHGFGVVKNGWSFLCSAADRSAMVPTMTERI